MVTWVDMVVFQKDGHGFQKMEMLDSVRCFEGSCLRGEVFSYLSMISI